MRTLRFLLVKEFLQIRRDRIMSVQILLMPLVQLALLANAATFELKETPVLVVDADRSATSRRLARAVDASEHFAVRDVAPSIDHANEALLLGRAAMILHVPPDFERDLARTGSAPVQLVLDAEDGAAAGLARAWARSIINRFAAENSATLRPPTGLATGPRAPTIELRTRGWYNPSLEYSHYMVPGILVQLVTLIGMLLTAMNIVREKEIGTLEQLNATPITRGQFVAAKLIPFWIIAMIELALGLALARHAFGVPMEGSVLLIFAIAAVYLVAALGLGLWISTVAETQQQAMFVTFFVVMIFLLMSGLFTPIRSMPAWAQWLAQLSPLTHFIRIMRAILLEGAGFAAIKAQFFVLVGFATVIFGLAIRQYSKTSA